MMGLCCGGSTPDSITGLTGRDLRNLAKTCNLIGHRNVIKDNSMDLFLLLFEKYPETKQYFEQFRNMEMSNLGMKILLSAHGTVVMYSIMSHVAQAHDPVMLLAMMKKGATSHVKRGIGSINFQKMGNIFDDYLDIKLKRKSTAALKESWKKYFDLFYTVAVNQEAEMSGHKESSGESHSGRQDNQL